MTPTYYCPKCDTLLDVFEHDDEPDMPGIDVHLECPCCLWEAGAIEKRTYCGAWESVLWEHNYSQGFINELPVEE